MSLKAFHIVFISASILLAFGFCAWLVQAYRSEGETWQLVMGVGSGLTGVGLVFYERYFLKKHKHISYI